MLFFKLGHCPTACHQVMTNSGKRLAENLARVKDRIAAAAERSGRRPDQVKLIAVTKYVDANITRKLVEAGCLDLGESRPQELWQKAELLADLNVNWHMIGHLQRNKVRRTLPLVSLIHSVDSVRLLQSIESLAEELSTPTESRMVEVLLEVNVSGEEAKHGFAPDACLQAIETALDMSHVRVQGLMCMAHLGSGQEGARRDFASLRALRDQLQESCDAASLGELSMGMSGDFEEAIKAGSTIVRIGSALFEGVTS